MGGDVVGERARPRARVAVFSLHTSPLDQPGTGDSGGMNVYIRAVAERLAAQGVDVDVFTRCRGRNAPEVEEILPGHRLIQVQAGPCAPVPKEDLQRFLPRFWGRVLERQRHEGTTYDVVHSHYWLSGWVGRSAKEIWGAPLVASFHTLGKVKNFSLARDEGPEPGARLDGEERVIAQADRILSATPAEAAHLVGLYGADPERIRVVPPGVDHSVFFPRSAEDAKARLHLSGARLVLFVGRLQPHKGPDVAITALAEAVSRDPRATEDVVLAVVGGPSGRSGGGTDEVSRLMALASSSGVGDHVMFFPPQPQMRLADFYSAAEVVLVPSRSESFGLVALEAQACGTPVLAAATGGLRYVVDDGETGFLVNGWDPADYADRLLSLLGDPTAARRMGTAGVARALRFSWDTTAAEILSVYSELWDGDPPRPASLRTTAAPA
ncbi:MAG: D-inositol-3-phosphate glycosyltransferase [Actinomycetota bacterium]